jgi:hypothetical protein
MTRNRKADLQRKLTMAPVATPPAGLADRIKSEIPTHFGFEAERTQSRKSVMFNLRIAASIIFLVSSLYLVLRLVSRTEPNTRFASDSTAATATHVAVALPSTPPEPGSARPQPRADFPAMPSAPPPTSIAVIPNARIAEAKHNEAVRMSNGTSSLANNIEDETPKMKKEEIVVTAEAPVIASPSPAATAVDQAAPVGAVQGGTAATGFARERAVAKSAAAAPRLSDERDFVAAPARDFGAIKDAISRGETLRSADTSAIVQHFAAPERAPAALRVELEASAMPLNSTKWLLRVSVDAPYANETSIDLDFGDAVASHHALAGSPAPNETALYEIEFKPNALPDQTIATVRAGNVKTALRVTELRTWRASSTRMKRASLAATWARTPQSRTQTEAIVAKAREAHIDDLADIVERVERNQ